VAVAPNATTATTATARPMRRRDGFVGATTSPFAHRYRVPNRRVLGSGKPGNPPSSVEGVGYHLGPAGVGHEDEPVPPPGP
jgi:hypothetical protein